MKATTHCGSTVVEHSSPVQQWQQQSAVLQRTASQLWHASWIALLQVRDSRVPLLKKAADRLLEGSKFSSLRQEMDSFRSQNPWVEDSALFFCLIKLQVRCHGICNDFLCCHSTSSSQQANSLWSSHTHRCQAHSILQALPGRQFSCFLAVWDVDLLPESLPPALATSLCLAQALALLHTLL